MAKDAITDYWLAHYATEHCTICGNTGVIDTRGICTAAWLNVGRLNYCICPNGQAMRKQGADLAKAAWEIRRELRADGL